MPSHFDILCKGFGVKVDRSSLEAAKLAGQVLTVGQGRDLELRQFMRIADDDGRRLRAGRLRYQPAGMKHVLGGPVGLGQEESQVSAGGCSLERRGVAPFVGAQHEVSYLVAKQG